MNLYRLKIPGLVWLLVTAAAANAATAPTSHLNRFLESQQVTTEQQRPDSLPTEPISRPLQQLSLHKIAGSDDQCTVFVDYPYYALYGWMTGFELYESYMDLRYPLVTCDTIYPFMVTHVCMTLALNAPGSLYVQAFIADLDPAYSTPGCPYPGDLIEVSPEYPGFISQPGVYILDIDFDPPVEVTGPYFAGMFYACDMTTFDPGIAIDTVPYLCIDYNDWGYGLYDLASNPYYPFPGSIDLFSIGYNGGSGSEPLPCIVLPGADADIYAADPVWVAELVDTAEYMGCYFEYWSGADWQGFGADLDGNVTLRDGINPAQHFDGWLSSWNPAALPEASYILRASIIELDSNYVSDSVTVTFDHFPLQPSFVGLSDFADACEAETLTVTVSEPEVLAVTFSFRELLSTSSRALLLLDRNDYGDANSNPFDGNHYYAGEFGEYYSAPTLLASLIKYWADHGYAGLLDDGDTVLTTSQLVETLAAQMHIRSNLGAEDDNTVWATLDFIQRHGGQLENDVSLTPHWDWLAARFFGDRAAVALAVSRPYGHWLAVDQILVDQSNRDSVAASLYDPAGGILRQALLLVDSDSINVLFTGDPDSYKIDLAIALYPELDTTVYRFFASDSDGTDDFRAPLPMDSLDADSYYLIRARAHQSAGGVASDYWITRYHCAAAWLPGDADYNGAVNIADAVYLVGYMFGSGPAPLPTWEAGDADCSGALNMSDVVYLLAYVFGAGPAPCEP